MINQPLSPFSSVGGIYSHTLGYTNMELGSSLLYQPPTGLEGPLRVSIKALTSWVPDGSREAPVNTLPLWSVEVWMSSRFRERKCLWFISCWEKFIREKKGKGGETFWGDTESTINWWWLYNSKSRPALITTDQKVGLGGIPGLGNLAKYVRVPLAYVDGLFFQHLLFLLELFYFLFLLRAEQSLCKSRVQQCSSIRSCW